MASRKRAKRDVEKNYPVRQLARKLRRLADCLEKKRPFRIQIAGQKVTIPPGAVINVEYERDGKSQEVEFEFEWRNE